jgi:hypothetical protein
MRRTPLPPDPQSGEGPGLRRWGVGLGAGGMALAIVIAILSCREEPRTPAASPAAVDTPGILKANPDADSPNAAQSEPGQAEAADVTPEQAGPARVQDRPPGRSGSAQTICPQGADRPEILAAFERSHPMSEAQRLFAAGRRDEARALAARLLAERRDLRGLCFARFTLGGAEIVLGAPDPASAAQWAERLSAMDGVAYAETNLVASPY